MTRRKCYICLDHHVAWSLKTFYRKPCIYDSTTAKVMYFASVEGLTAQVRIYAYISQQEAKPGYRALRVSMSQKYESHKLQLNSGTGLGAKLWSILLRLVIDIY